jgi:antitoxin component of RelBE/YafQ-DinJ toxin-antitoxin module
MVDIRAQFAEQQAQDSGAANPNAYMDARAQEDVKPFVPPADPSTTAPVSLAPDARINVFQGGKPTNLSVDELDKLDPATDARVNVKDPSGNLKSIPVKNLSLALSKGYTPESSVDYATRKVDEADIKAGFTGSLKQAGDSFANQFAFGVPNIVRDHTDTQEERSAREHLESRHKLARFVGGAGGLGANLLTTEGLGTLARGALETADVAAEAAPRVAEALLTKETTKIVADTAVAQGIGKAESMSLARNLVNKAGAEAVKGALLSAPAAATEEYFGDHEAAAENLLAGVGIGGLFGAAGGLGERGLQVLERSDGVASGSIKDSLETFADKANLKSYGFTKQYNKLIQKRFNPAEVAQITDELGVQRLGGESPTELYEKIAAKKQEVGSAIGDHIRSIKEELIPHSELETIKKTIIDGIEQDSGKGYTSNRKALAGTVEHFFADIPKKDNYTLADIWESGRDAAKNAKYDANVRSVGGQVFEKIDHSLSDLVNTTADQAERDGKLGFDKTAFADHPEVSDAIDNAEKTFSQKRAQLNKQYSLLVDLEKGAKDNITRETTNRPFGLLDTIVSSKAAAAGGIIGGMVAGPGGAAAGAFVGSQVGKVASNYIGREGYTIVGNASRQLANGKFGLLATEQAVKKFSDDLETKIPSLFNKTVKDSAKLAPEAALIRAVGDHISGKEEIKTRRSAFTKISEMLSEYHANPDSEHSQNIAALGQTIGDNGAPNISKIYQDKAHSALQYLYDNMPKSKSVPSPFQSNPAFRPTDQDLDSFQKRLSIVMDPTSILDSIKSNKLSAPEIDALKNVYPSVYETVKSRVMEYASKNNSTADYATRQKLDQLFGISGENNGQSVAFYQSAYAPMPPQSNTAPNKKQVFKVKDQGVQSQTDRVANK